MNKSLSMKSSLLFFVFLLWLSVTPITSFAWTIETVDSSGDVEGFNSIAADSNGNVHISYYDGSNRDLKYATNASGSWVAETVDSAGMVGLFTSIAADSNNKVHISYLDVHNCYLKYATNTSGLWVTETVGGAQTQMEPSSEYTSIAMDSYNTAHISYYDLFGGLKYATNIQSPWFTQSVDSAAVYAGMGNSVAVDPSLKVHISYFGDGDLKYATGYPGGPWDIQTVDRGVYGHLQFSSIVNTSIATDSNNKVYISYYDIFNDDLKYATNASGSWVTETVDSEGNVGWGTSIAVDSNDKVHISYIDWTNYDLKYATNAPNVPDISVSPTSYDFGFVTVGSLSAPQTFTISNTGAADLHISDITLSDIANYILDVNGGISPCGNTTPTITEGSNCTVTVTFNPTSAGQKDATLAINSDDPDTPNASVLLTGKGVTPHTGLTLLVPNGGEVILSGSIYTINWDAPSYTVKYTLRYSINNGSTWKLIAKNVTSTTYDWHVSTPSNNKTSCLVKVIGFNSFGVQLGEDISDSTFTIEAVKLTSPDGGESLTSGNSHTITWRTNGTIRPVAKAKLFYSTNAGSTWKAINTLTGNLGSYNWTIPNISSNSCKVKVVLKDTGGVTVGSDVSDGVFTIQP